MIRVRIYGPIPRSGSPDGDDQLTCREVMIPTSGPVTCRCAMQQAFRALGWRLQPEELPGWVMVCVDGKDVRGTGGLETLVYGGSTVAMVPVLPGG